jgi:hypothetical protein
MCVKSALVSPVVEGHSVSFPAQELSGTFVSDSAVGLPISHSGAFKCQIEKLRYADVCDQKGFEAYQALFETFGSHYGMKSPIFVSSRLPLFCGWTVSHFFVGLFS